MYAFSLQYDEDADGRISLSEMKRIVKSESFENDLPPRCVKRLLIQADENKDGFIDYNEFLKMVRITLFCQNCFVFCPCLCGNLFNILLLAD